MSGSRRVSTRTSECRMRVASARVRQRIVAGGSALGDRTGNTCCPKVVVPVGWAAIPDVTTMEKQIPRCAQDSCTPGCSAATTSARSSPAPGVAEELDPGSLTPQVVPRRFSKGQEACAGSSRSASATPGRQGRRPPGLVCLEANLRRRRVRAARAPSHACRRETAGRPSGTSPSAAGGPQVQSIRFLSTPGIEALPGRR
jgi:hypothetical protein